MMFERLRSLLSPPKPPHGEPITLEFACGDTITNSRPPLLPEHVRQTALEQALDTRCPKCAYSLWNGLELDNTLREMRVVLLDAWEHR